MQLKYDVVVGGGGLAGVSAAISSSKNGVQTLLIERYGSLGGLATNGLVAPFMKSCVFKASKYNNILKEIFYRLKKFDKKAVYKRAFDPECLKMVLYEYLLENNVKILLHSYIIGVQVKNNSIDDLIIANKQGLNKIKAKIFIDATGDGDIAAYAGEEFFIGDSNAKTQALTLIFRIGNVKISKVLKYCFLNKEHFKFIEDNGIVSIAGFTDLINREKEKGNYTVPLDYIFFTTSPRKDIIVLNCTRVINVNPLNPFELTYAEIEGHKQAWQIYRLLKQHVPGFEKSYIIDTANQIGIRESRRIKGQYVLSEEDILNATKFKDAISCNDYPIDVHSQNNKDMYIRLPEKAYYDIPLRAIIAKKNKNLFVIGRCISSTHLAHSSVRIMPVCISVGESAGKYAAYCVKRNILPHDLEFVA